MAICLAILTHLHDFGDAGDFRHASGFARTLRRADPTTTHA